VTLSIYDILCQEVATLVSGHRPAGKYTAKWDASERPSGVYYYRITAGDFTAVRKMILLK
jgi:hypothetical protein